MKVDGDNLYLLGTQGDYYADFPDNYVATGMMAYWSDYFDFSALEFSNHDGSGDDLPWGVRINIAPAVPANPPSTSGVTAVMSRASADSTSPCLNTMSMVSRWIPNC